MRMPLDEQMTTDCGCRAAGSKLPVSLTAYSVVGAAAYMGGSTRMTLTTTVMVMETTGALQLIVPIMLTVWVSKVRQSLARSSELAADEP